MNFCVGHHPQHKETFLMNLESNDLCRDKEFIEQLNTVPFSKVVIVDSLLMLILIRSPFIDSWLDLQYQALCFISWSGP